MNTTKSYAIKLTELTEKRFLPLLLAAALLFSFATTLLIARPSGAIFDQAFLRLDRMKAATATGGRVCAEPATVATEADVQVVFPTGFTVNGTAGNWDVNTTDLDTGQTAWPGIGTEATAVSGQTVTFSSTDLTVGTLYCFNFVGVSTLTNPAANPDLTGTITTRTSGPATIDQSSYAVAVIAEDQILVTATVPPTFSFSIASCTSGSCTDAFTQNLSPSNIRTTAGKAITISTNAANGWIAWVKDSAQGLTSATQTYTIATTAAGSTCAAGHGLSAGTEGYGLDIDLTTNGAGGGNPAIDANYDCGANDAGGLDSVFLPAATSSGAANGDVITLVAKAAISNLTPAATDYQDIITVVGAGNF